MVNKGFCERPKAYYSASMSRVNKASLRDELEKLKSEFASLSSAKKVPSESAVLIKALFALMEVMVAVFLEKQTKKNNRNSSLPSSQTEKAESSTRPGRHSNGRKENGERFSNSRTRESTKVSKVSYCETCGEDLKDIPCECHERRTKIDIIFEKVVTHVDAEIKTCPNCEATTKGRFPSDMAGPLQYGVGIKAYILNLLVAQMVALGRIQKLVHTLLERTLSPASILRYVIELYNALESWEEASVQQLLRVSAMNVDETSLRVDKKNHWIHVYSSGDVTVKFLHRKRGKEAIDDINIIPRYGGRIIHDCWASYFSYDNCENGLCGSHLLRELTFVIESNGYIALSSIL